MPTATLRRLVLVVVVAASIGGLAPASSGADVPIPGDTGGYLSYADRLQPYLDPIWSDAAGRYLPGPAGSATGMNAEMLTVHAIAAQFGHTGPSRQDARARGIVSWLLGPAVWVERAPGGTPKHSHAPGWVSNPGHSGQHLVFDTPPAEALARAYVARTTLGLSDATVALIRDHLRRLVRGRYWRWPALRQNQFSWYAKVFAANATVNGEKRLFARTMRRHIARFVRHRAANFGPGLHFHYVPGKAADSEGNVDSAEYANIVLGYTEVYEQARGAGMPRPSVAERRFLKAWARRAVAGYWTHGGYMNWDTGLGFLRWHQTKKLPLAQSGLLGVATASEVTPGGRWRAWAKDLFDRSLAWYEREVVRTGDIPPPVLFGVGVVFQNRSNAYLAAARVQANAMRAALAGLGSVRAATPPPLYAYDPDIGRLAVTTPSYSTAIVAVSLGAFPYGGIELARLMDGRGLVAANIGGHPPASFGIVLRGRRGCTSQVPRHGLDRRVTPLRLVRAPSGVGVLASTRALRPYAGPFRDLRARGTVSCGDARLTTATRFTSGAITQRWAVRRRSRSRATVDVLLPSWGPQARAYATLRGGGQVAVTGRGIALRRVRALHIVGEDSGYRVVPLRRPAHAVVVARGVRPQQSNPRPGPTIVVRVARGSRARAFGFAARIVPEPR